MPGGYGAYEDRQLTAEEEEEQDVAAAKGEIKFIKQQDVASTRNARRIAEMAQQTGMETLTRLGQQGERIHNTERNLDTADQHQLLAEDKARELRTLNRSMFAVHVSNPFTANKRREAADALALDKRQSERRILDATRAAAHDSTARQQSNARDLQGNAIRPSQTKASLADRAKYQFEADSEDDEMENEIDSNLDAIHRSAKTLNQLGRAMGDEIDSQNKHIDRIIDKTDRVDDKIAVNRARLDRID
ncbi:Protein transport protein S9 plasma membrane t-SNARE [Elasticomyces elasticus]|nr:Protein transport protein S9 plasma membrane t-SNARE [Elasticomyces elasticus]